MKFFLLLCCTIFCLPAQAAAEVVLNFGHSNAANERSQNHYFYLKFSELANKYSNGEITINEFPSNQLGGEQVRVNKARTQRDLITMASTPNVSPFAPSAGIFNLPYIFNDTDEILKLLRNEFGTQIVPERILKESGLRVLGWLIAGFRHVTNSKHCVQTIDDLKKLKIRVPKEAIMLNTFKSWDVNAVTLSWPETFSALQQGVVDGQINSYITVYAASFHEVQKYITPMSVTPWIAPVLIGESGFKRLKPEHQDALLRAGKEASLLEQEWAIKKDKEFEKALVDRGMVICHLKDESVFKERARGIWPDHYGEVGGKELVDLALKHLE
jgi:TRAP-type transport system periplasmic protein